MPLGNPLWGQAIAQAFQQGTSGVQDAMRFRHEEAERKRLEEEAKQRMRAQFMAQNPEFTNDPSRVELQAPEAVLGPQAAPRPTNVRGDTPAAPNITTMGPRAISGVSRVSGMPAPTAPVQEHVRDMGDEFADVFGVRYRDHRSTPEYQEAEQDRLRSARLSGLALGDYAPENIRGMEDADQIEELVAIAQGRIATDERTRGEAQFLLENLSQLERDAAAAGAQIQHPEGLDLSMLYEHPYFGQVHDAQHEGYDQIGNRNRQIQDRNYGLAARELDLASGRANAQRAPKIDPQLELTMQNAREAHALMTEVGGPTRSANTGATIGGILGVGEIERPLIQWFQGDNKTMLDEGAVTFTEGFLRKMTGAAISETEFRRYAMMFIPVSNDRAEVERKTRRRQNLLNAMERMAAQGATQEQIQGALAQDATQAQTSGSSIFDGATAPEQEEGIDLGWSPDNPFAPRR